MYFVETMETNLCSKVSKVFSEIYLLKEKVNDRLTFKDCSRRCPSLLTIADALTNDFLAIESFKSW